MREVVLGKNASVWRTLKLEPVLAHWADAELSHRDLAGFEFTADDRVWVFAYSREAAENQAMLQKLSQAGVGELVYVSSSSVIVERVTQCYAYPRVKAHAQAQALQLPKAKVLTLGLVYSQPEELPAGTNMATSYAELAAFMRTPTWPDEAGRGCQLFRQIQRPMRHSLESVAFACYGGLLRVTGRTPCLLRPLDLVLRLLGMRWYGYTYLSNRLWTLKT